MAAATSTKRASMLPRRCPVLQEIFADEHADGRVWDRCTIVAYFPPEVRARCRPRIGGGFSQLRQAPHRGI